MFDPETAHFIRNAPPLEEIDLARLPELLTRTHTWIATLRLRLAESRTEAAESQDDGGAVEGMLSIPEVPAFSEAALAEDLAQLRRVARTYATHAVSLPDEGRASAAYVAASAYRLLQRAVDIGALPGRRGSYLARESVSSDVSSLLLFLAAGYTADAREVAETLRWERDNTYASRCLSALQALCRGELDRIRRFNVTSVRPLYERGEDPATEALWQHTLKGLQLLASLLSGEEGERDARGRRRDGESPRDVFTRVRTLAVAPLGLEGVEGLEWEFSPTNGETSGELFTPTVLDTYAGPHHVAALLAEAWDRLRGLSVVEVPTPPGVLPDVWRAYLADLATRRRRPYLWPNHLEAINGDLLAPGTSAVVNYPTGAGKSTLSELKIAATVHRGRRVIFLAPTRALVWQTYQALRGAFPDVRVAESPVGESTYEETESAANAAILVMTPERCLTFLGIEPDAFTDVGLVVFDECHLMHPKDGVRDRRSLDAMLCILGLLDVARESDVMLLSAMMRNAKELAKWISFATGNRPCLEVQNGWKPTRQVRGCLAYVDDDVERLQAVAFGARRGGRRTARGRPTAEVQREMAARPYGIFGLQQRWLPAITPEGFALLPLLDEDAPLTLNTQWQLSPNKNAVSALLAARMAQAGVKVLVFVQNKGHCASVCEEVASALPGEQIPLRLTDREAIFAAAAAEDLGDPSLVIGPVSNVAAMHHSLLLPPERRLNEAVFERSDGVNVLVATPTLAQGMNLPAEAVIVAGDERFDREVGDRARIAAHELLNAAGRAGRAGHHGSGIVIVVPDRVMKVATDLSSADPALRTLSSTLMSKADQCLDIDDPVEHLLDKVETASSEENRLVRYFVTRLPVSDDLGNPAMVASRILGRSLAAYRAHARRDPASFQTKLETALAVRRAILAQPDAALWMDQVASQTGYAPARIHQMARALRVGRPANDSGVLDWLAWTFAWLESDPTLTLDLLDRQVFAFALTKAEASEAASPGGTTALLSNVHRRVEAWMTGVSLMVLDGELRPPFKAKSRCKAAREFVSRFIVEFSHLAGTVAQVRRRQLEVDNAGDVDEADALPMSLAVLGACVREGLSTPEQLAVRYESDVYATSRVACHRLGDELARRTAGKLLSFAELRAAAASLIGKTRVMPPTV